MREHGGNLDLAIQRFGGHAQDWIDLSTGINRHPYPVEAVPPQAWQSLPSHADINALHQTARRAYATDSAILATAGAQAAIQMVPRLAPPGLARILSPTYNEYAAALSAAGWSVEEVATVEELAGADLAVVVNPNNPDGRCHAVADLLALLPQVGRLVVDESFADARPDLSLAPHAGRNGLLVLRSFGKFYGLAGLRLGFVLGPRSDIDALSAMAGPWPVSGAAIVIGQRALSDRGWALATRDRLLRDGARMDAMASALGFRLIGGTALFRLYDVGDAEAAQAKLAQNRVWSRVFAQHPKWLRLGLPGDETEWSRLTAALAR